MRTTTRRYRCRPKTATTEGTFFKKESQESFFGNGTEHDTFFQPAITHASAQNVQRKCSNCEKEDKKLQRTEEDKKEEGKLMKMEDKKEEEKVQRQPENKEEEKVMKMGDNEEEKVQKKENGASVTAGNSVSNYTSSLSGKGQALPAQTNDFFSSKMGYDFSDVKIHKDKEAAESAKDINAQAYAYGNNIVFGQGRYQPESQEGKHLLAHELAHVVQQNGKNKVFTQAAPVLTPAQISAATRFNRGHYDERSVRVIQLITGTGVDGIFGPATARAVAVFQGANGIAVSGQVDMPTLEVMLTNRVTANRREHIVQLVVDFLDLPVAANTLSVHFDATVGFLSMAVTTFEPGNMRIIRLGPLAFLTASILGIVINRELNTPAPALPALAPRPTILTKGQETAAIAFNRNHYLDARARRIIQGLVGASPDGQFGADTVQRIAQFQHANGLVEDGQAGRASLSQMCTNLIAAGNQDSAIRLIIDFFNIRDNGNLLDVFFDATLASANASTDFRVNEPVRVRVGPSGISQPFEGLVHTIAHEFEHVRRLKEGIVAASTHEFLGEAVEILSVGMPAENLEGLAPGVAGFVAGFADDAGRAVDNWNLMSLADRRRFRDRFIAVRNVVRRRIAAGSPVQQALHAPLLATYNAVVLP